jgi:hypothetical protein
VAGGKAEVTDIRLFDGDGPAIAKKRLRFGWDEIAPVVKTMFDHCMTAKASPMPAACPSARQVSSLTHATWRLTADPVLNARHHYNSETGLISVVGSYAATVTGRMYDWMEPSEYSQAGNYEAILVVEGDKPVPLRIEAR